MLPKIKKERLAQIEILNKENIPALTGGYFNIDRTNKGKDNGVLNFETSTLVNLLGTYGNFEDANILQAGWTSLNTTNSKTTTSVIGTKAQKAVSNSTNGSHYIYKPITEHIIVGHKYFISFFNKNTNSKTWIRILNKNSAGVDEILWIEYVEDSSYKQHYKSFSPTSINVTPFTRLGLNVVQTDNTETYSGTTEEINIDGVQLVDLTNMGSLPDSLKKYFNNLYTNWSDLATTSNITAIDGRIQTGEDWLAELLPYVDSVSSVGYNYTDGELVTEVENKGENLIDLSKIVIDSSAVYTTFVQDTKIIHLKNGTMGAFASFYFPVYLKKGVTYTLKGKLFLNSNASMIILKYKNTFVESIFFIANAGTFDVNKTFTVSESGLFFLHPTFQADTVTNGKMEIENLQLFEGTESTDYTPARTDKFSFNTFLFSQYGISDKLFMSDNKLQKLKMWEKEIINFDTLYKVESLTNYYPCLLKTTNISLPGSNGIMIGENGRIIRMVYTYNYDALHYYLSENSILIYIEKTKIDAMSGSTTIEKAQNYFATYPHTIIYQLATPVIEDVEYQNTISELTKNHNYFVSNSAKYQLIESDGVSTTYSHSLGTSDIKVYVNGKFANPVITSTDITFETAPRYSDIIEVYKSVQNNNLCGTIELYEPSGLLETIYADTFSVVEENNQIRATYADYSEKIQTVDRKYTISMTFPSLADVQNFVEKYKDKVFRIKLTESDGNIEYYSKCKIIDNVTNDKNEYTQSVTIRCSDFYGGDYS